MLRITNTLLIMLSLPVLLYATAARAATYYMPDNFPTLQAAFAGMSSGDTLIIRDGIYTGTSNVIHGNSGGAPPNGTPLAYTTIKAENNGKVTFDGQNTRMMFNIAGGTHKYIQFEGIKWVNMPSGKQAVLLSEAEYIKFFRCGATTNGAASSWHIGASSYVLLEECYAWGRGRYGFNVYNSSRIVLRRCVDRRDDANGAGFPIANFQNYCSRFVEFQNCIAIDTDDQYFSNFSETEGAYDVHAPVGSLISEDGWWRGVIALNIDMDRPGDTTGWRGRFGGAATWNSVYRLTYENVVFWDVTTGIRGSMNNDTISLDHATIGKSTSPGREDGWYNTSGKQYGTITNSLIYGHARYGLSSIATSNHNSFYNNGADYNNTPVGTNDLSAANGNAIDPIDGLPGNNIPSLRYLLRIEDNSDLDGAASDGSDIGATILKRIGVSGTLYGEQGYNSVTSENLWPFPYEDQIRADMRTYSGTAPANRGFCADGMTLTKYIWEYLGNPVPKDFSTQPDAKVTPTPTTLSTPDIFSIK